MVIGVPKEIKDNEHRVSMAPSGVRALSERGHRIIVQSDAGRGSGFLDDEYADAGAEILNTAEDVYRASDMMVKVKEPLPEEYPFLREGLIVFAFFHIAANRSLTERLMDAGCTAIAYETIETDDGRLPLLMPMSEVAGRLSVQVGAHYLMSPNGGRGVLLSGVPGVAQARVAILGGGTVGYNAMKIAIGMGAEVTVMDKRVERFRFIDNLFGGRVETLLSTSYNISRIVKDCDLLIGAVLIPGSRAPQVVSGEMVSTMREGSVIVDVSVDQGGCVETTRPTTHSQPTYKVEGVIHYGVSNIPAAVPRTSTLALTNVTLPYIADIADLGFLQAVRRRPSFFKGVNVYKRSVTLKVAADTHNMKFIPLTELL